MGRIWDNVTSPGLNMGPIWEMNVVFNGHTGLMCGHEIIPNEIIPVVYCILMGPSNFLGFILLLQ